MFLPLVVTVLAMTTTTPLDTVKRGNDEVQKLLSSNDASVEKLAAKADEFVDFVELAKRALGKEWDKLQKKQQSEFSQTMKALLRASYANRALKDGKGAAKVEYAETKQTGNEATVETTFVVNAKDRFPVEYRLFRTDAKGTWKVYDVVTDEVSLLATYQDQFKTLIAKKGFDGLLATLKSRREQLEKPAAAGPPPTASP